MTTVNRSGDEIEQMRSIYKERYGVEISWLEANQIRKAEREIAQCEGCKGLPCRKAKNQYTVPIIGKEFSDFVGRYECQWGKQLAFKKDCRLARLPSKYEGYTFQDYKVTNDNERAIRIAKDYVRDKPSKSLYFYGGYGTGKTFLAALIAKEFINAGKSVMFGDMPDLLDELKSTFDSAGMTTAELLNRYCDCDLLVMDDVGAGQLTAWNVGITYQIINRRYNENKATLITSNLDLDALKERFKRVEEFAGGRIVSRLSEMCVQAFFGTNDRRK